MWYKILTLEKPQPASHWAHYLRCLAPSEFCFNENSDNQQSKVRTVCQAPLHLICKGISSRSTSRNPVLTVRPPSSLPPTVLQTCSSCSMEDGYSVCQRVKTNLTLNTFPFPSGNHHTVVYEFLSLFFHLLLLVVYLTWVKSDSSWLFVWLILFSMIFSRSIHVVASGSISSFLVAK